MVNNRKLSAKEAYDYVEMVHGYAKIAFPGRVDTKDGLYEFAWNNKELFGRSIPWDEIDDHFIMHGYKTQTWSQKRFFY